MNLDELQTVQSRERQTDSLQQLRESFYADAGEFIRSLRAERDEVAASAEDPFDAPEVNRLTDDVGTAERTVEAIYERRVGKLVKMASLAAADMAVEDDGLTAEERDLFEELVAAIQANRERVLAELSGEAGQETPASGADGRDEAADDEGEADQPTPDGGVHAAGSDDADPAGTTEDVDRTTVRITREVGEILGVDERAYDLSPEDVVTLPTTNAEPLLERDAAERLD